VRHFQHSREIRAGAPEKNGPRAIDSTGRGRQKSSGPWLAQTACRVSLHTREIKILIRSAPHAPLRGAGARELAIVEHVSVVPPASPKSYESSAFQKAGRRISQSVRSLLREVRLVQFRDCGSMLPRANRPIRPRIARLGRRSGAKGGAP